MDDTKEPDGKLDAVFKRAMRRFNETVLPQQQMRAEALLARRFVTIPGAQWEGPWGEQFENSIKVEVPKIARGVRKIETDYRQNRIAPDFRPDGGGSDQETADTLDGLYRADAYKYGASQGIDNAAAESFRGGFGAYRLANVLEDEHDPDNEYQRINPGMIIPDADQRVFFDMQSPLYDKSSARFAFVLSAYTPDAYKEEFEGQPISWPDTAINRTWDWYRPEIVYAAEYYEKEDVRDKLHILTQTLTGIEERFYASEVPDEELEERKLAGWIVETKNRKRIRVHKYILSGQAVIEDSGVIAGEYIPIVPVYGQREFVDGMERFKGHVQDRMDSQRLYNSNVSRLAETNARSPQEIPIFAAEQMPPNIAELWSRLHIDRHPYAIVNPLIDPGSGQLISAGPIGKIEPPQLEPVTATLLQIANTDLVEDDADSSEDVKSNVSAEAMDIAANRVDAKSGIYLDNVRQSIEYGAKVYLSMAREVYADHGRTVETMSEDGDDGEEILGEPIKDDKGFRFRNDLSNGKYKVIASVTEATATRRDKTVRSSLNMAEMAMKAGDMELAKASILTAIANSDGEGIDDLKAFARKAGLSIGLFEPNEEEQADAEKAAENQQPDPTGEVLAAQSAALNAQAQKDGAQADKTVAETELTKAKVEETKANTLETLSEFKSNGIISKIKEFVGR